MKRMESKTMSLDGLKRWAGVAMLAVALAGCGGMSAYREGNALLAAGKTEQGLAKLEEAVRLDPANAEYRIALASRRASLVNQWLAAGDALRRSARLAEAEQAYRQVQAIEPDNAMARQGLDALRAERRHQVLMSEAEALARKGTPGAIDDALEKLRPILIENPMHKGARNLKMQLDETKARELRPEAKLAATFRKPISLEFRDAPLRSVLEVVSKVSGLNFYYDKDIRADLKTTIFARNTTIEDALRVLLVTNQLEQKVLSENSLLIYPSTPQKLRDYQTQAVRTFYLTNADVKAVSNTLKTILKTRDLVVDERLGIIIMRDTPEAIRMAERIVALQDLSDPEVMLEVEILEIKRSRLLELGIQWPSQLTLSPLQVGGTPLTLADLKGLTQATTRATIGSVIVNARKEDQDGNILANPRIRVRNKEKAKVQIGDRVPVITTTSTSTGFISESVSYVDVGLKLEVEPTIYLDDEVAIKVNLEVSNLVREILSKSGTLSYQIGTRGATTVLRLKDGETQILAGLISDEDRSSANKVPLLGELPVAGRLFGSQKDDTQRSEILLSITPHVVRSIQRPDMVAAEFEAGTQSSIGAPSLRLAPPAASDGATVAVPSPAASGPQAGEAAGQAAAPGDVSLDWQGPAQVKVGEQFIAVLRLSSTAPLRGLPLVVGFDPKVLDVSDVEEGSYFKQDGGGSHFSHRVDPAQGKIFIDLVRESPSDEAGAGGANGAGTAFTINFRASKPGDAKIEVLSVNPEPPSTSAASLRPMHSVKVVP